MADDKKQGAALESENEPLPLQGSDEDPERLGHEVSEDNMRGHHYASHVDIPTEDKKRTATPMMRVDGVLVKIADKGTVGGRQVFIADDGTNYVDDGAGLLIEFDPEAHIGGRQVNPTSVTGGNFAGDGEKVPDGEDASKTATKEAPGNAATQKEGSAGNNPSMGVGTPKVEKK